MAPVASLRVPLASRGGTVYGGTLGFVHWDTHGGHRDTSTAHPSGHPQGHPRCSLRSHRPGELVHQMPGSPGAGIGPVEMPRSQKGCVAAFVAFSAPGVLSQTAGKADRRCDSPKCSLHDYEGRALDLRAEHCRAGVSENVCSRISSMGIERPLGCMERLSLDMSKVAAIARHVKSDTCMVNKLIIIASTWTLQIIHDPKNRYDFPHFQYEVTVSQRRCTHPPDWRPVFREVRSA